MPSNPEIKRPTVSIIIPVYNNLGGLVRLLGTCERLTWPRELLEIIIVNDGSTDRIVSFLADYSFSGLLEIESDLSGLVEECFPGAIEWERVAYISKNSPKITLPESITVRMLNASDAEQLSTIDEKWIWKYFGDPQGLIENMPAAGCFMDGELVSVSSVFTESSEYSDIAAATKNTHQGKNFGTSCAAFLSEFIIREQHKRIAWNTSPDNPPSVRIAEKLGFEKYELRTKLYKINWNPA